MIWIISFGSRKNCVWFFLGELLVQNLEMKFFSKKCVALFWLFVSCFCFLCFYFLNFFLFFFTLFYALFKFFRFLRVLLLFRIFQLFTPFLLFTHSFTMVCFFWLYKYDESCGINALPFNEPYIKPSNVHRLHSNAFL